MMARKTAEAGGHNWRREDVRKFRCVQEEIKKRYLEADMMMSLFTAMVKSRSAVASFTPFPNTFLDNWCEGNMYYQIRACKALPSLSKVQNMTEAEIHECDENVKKLLYALFFVHSRPILKRREPKQLKLLLSHEPKNVYELVYSRLLNNKWKKRVRNRELSFGFIAVRLESSLWKIREDAYQSNYKKGDKQLTFMASTMSLSLKRSSRLEKGERPDLAYKLHFVAVFEIILDKNNQVYFCDSENPMSFNIVSFGVQEVPPGYYLIRNSNMVRIKYIMSVLEDKEIISDEEEQKEAKKKEAKEGKHTLGYFGYKLAMLGFVLLAIAIPAIVDWYSGRFASPRHPNQLL